MKPIGDLLSGGPVHTLRESATVLEAARAMTEHKVGALLIVDASDRLAGIFTERDLMGRVVVPGLDPKSVRVREVMTRDLVTATPEDRVNAIAERLQERHIRHIPVLRDGAVIGILSLRDLLREHVELKRREVRELTAYIQGDEPKAL